MRAFLRFFFGIKCKQSKDRTVHCVFAGPSVSWKDFGASLWVRAIQPGSGRAPCGHPSAPPRPAFPSRKGGGLPTPTGGAQEQQRRQRRTSVGLEKALQTEACPADDTCHSGFQPQPRPCMRHYVFKKEHKNFNVKKTTKCNPGGQQNIT